MDAPTPGSELRRPPAADSSRWLLVTLWVAMPVGVWSGLLLGVVPRFESLFQTLGSSLPASTRILVGISAWVRQYVWSYAALCAIGVWMYVQFTKQWWAADWPRFTRWHQVLMILVNGIVIGWFVIALFSPIYQIALTPR